MLVGDGKGDGGGVGEGGSVDVGVGVKSEVGLGRVQAVASRMNSKERVNTSLIDFLQWVQSRSGEYVYILYHQVGLKVL
jgi:hypothetical protein